MTHNPSFHPPPPSSSSMPPSNNPPPSYYPQQPYGVEGSTGGGYNIPPMPNTMDQSSIPPYQHSQHYPSQPSHPSQPSQPSQPSHPYPPQSYPQNYPQPQPSHNLPPSYYPPSSSDPSHPQTPPLYPPSSSHQAPPTTTGTAFTPYQPYQTIQPNQPPSNLQTNQLQTNPNLQTGYNQNSNYEHSLSQDLANRLTLNSQQGTMYSQPQQGGMMHPQQPQHQVNLTPLSSFPRPQFISMNVDPNQPDVSPLFERAKSVDMSRVQSSTRFIRATAQCAPNTPSLQAQWGLPFGAILTPFAECEERVPVVSMGASGVVRCDKCRSYINPFVLWMDGGRRWQCNLCRITNDVPTSYFSPLDETGMRKDIRSRPELTHGSIDLIATKEYYSRKNPQPASYLFVIDVSPTTVRSGALRIISETILKSLDRLAGDVRTRVGFITFDSTVHFYNLRKTLKSPQRLVVGELEESLLPIPTDLLVNLFDSKQIVETLLKKLPEMFETMLNDRKTLEGSCLGAALNAAGRILGKIGGKLSLFTSTIPTLGPNSLKNRELFPDTDSSKDHEILKPVNSNYRDLALLFSRDQICVDQFVLTGQYIDLASLSPLSKFTAGQIKHYPGFDAQRDGSSLQYDIMRSLTREQGLEAVMKIRVSSGFKIKAFYGNFFIRGHDLLALPGIDADKSFGIDISHTGTFVSTPNACIQAAILYTNMNGERRVRIHNIILPLTYHLSDMYRHTDIDAVCNLLTKIAVDDITKNGVEAQRQVLTKTVLETLKSYQKNVRGTQISGGLSLPDSLKLFPLSILGALRHNAFFTSQIRADSRIAAISEISTASVSETVIAFHPLLFSLDAIPQLEDGDDIDSIIDSQNLLPLSMRYVSNPEGTYLLCNGKNIYVYHNLDPNNAVAQDVAEVVKTLNTFPLPKPDTLLGETQIGRGLFAMVYRLRKTYRFMHIHIITFNTPIHNNPEFSKLFIEDALDKDPSYENYIGTLQQTAQ